MQGLDTGGNGLLTAGAQDYYNSIFDLYASWGVDYVKVDDMLSSTYHSADVTGVAAAIAQSGRPMVLSLSPGPAPLNQASQLVADANMWRMLNDMWDDWSDVSSAFSAAASWEQYAGPGHWPDADMLPLGSFLNPPVGTARTSQLTHDQERTVMSLWSMVRSPLIMGGDLPSLAGDSWTTSLLTNANIISIDQSSINNHQVSNANNQIIWAANNANSTATYVALFNTGAASTPISATYSSVGLTANGTYDVWDEWKNIDLGNWIGDSRRRSHRMARECTRFSPLKRLGRHRNGTTTLRAIGTPWGTGHRAQSPMPRARGGLFRRHYLITYRFYRYPHHRWNSEF